MVLVPVQKLYGTTSTYLKVRKEHLLQVKYLSKHCNLLLILSVLMTHFESHLFDTWGRTMLINTFLK